MKTLKRTVSFLDADNHRAKIAVEVTYRNGYPEFTVTGDYFGSSGQCQDRIKPRTHEQKLLIGLWNDYHLTNLTKIPANISFYPSFEGHVNSIIDAIEAEEKKKEISDTIEQKMHEWGIDESDKEACEAYLEATGEEDLQHFQERYCGEYRDDEDFAREQADDLGLINNNVNWPNNCIDWEQAARELMMDYYEQNGHYFRNY